MMPDDQFEPAQQQQQQYLHQQMQHAQLVGGTGNEASGNMIPLPPSATIETSSEPPRTLWMGDLDPSFDEATIQQIWQQLNKRVFVKLIRAKKNLLIPCSSTAGANSNSGASLSPTTTNNASPPTAASPNNKVSGDNSEQDTIENSQKININGVSFIDPATTPLHHAGYCFVEFETQQDAQYALSLNSSPLPNVISGSTNLPTNASGQRNFRLNWASGATLQSSIPSRPEFSLFVGDLSPTATEADLLSLFQQKFRSVKTVRVMTDPITGASRCFGFVRFGNEEERRRALVEMNGVWCQGRCLRVAYATPRNNMMWHVQSQQQQIPPLSQQQQQQQQLQQQQPQQQQQQAQQPHLQQHTPLLVKTANNMMTGNTGGMNPGNNLISMPMSQKPSASSMSSNSTMNSVNMTDYSSTHAFTTDPNNTTVFIGGLTPKINETQLQALFSPFGNIITVKIPQGKNCGFVKYESRIDAEAAIQGMQGFIVGGNPIRLSWGRNTSTGLSPSGGGSVINNGQQLSSQQYFPQQTYGGYQYVPMGHSHSTSSVSSQPMDMYQKVNPNPMYLQQTQQLPQQQVWSNGMQWNNVSSGNMYGEMPLINQQIMQPMQQQHNFNRSQNQQYNMMANNGTGNSNSTNFSNPTNNSRDAPSIHPSVLR